MIEYDPNIRRDVVLYQIVPSILKHHDKQFQLRQLGIHEQIANELNNSCEIQIDDLTQFFDDARNEVFLQHETLEQIVQEP